MKKILPVILCLAVALMLCGCKSEEVKNVEAMIGAIGTVSAESLDAIYEAKDAYNALPEEEKADVKNYETLMAAFDDCMEQVLVGKWVYEPTYFYNVEEEMYDKVDITLGADMNAEGNHVSGVWRVENGELRINNGEGDYLYHIYREDGNIRIGSINSKMIRTEELAELLDAMFVTVELTPENVADYCQVVIYTEIEEDDFGTVTGDTRTYATLTSTVLDDGLVYVDCSDDMAVELLIPEHKYKYTSNNGKTWRSYKEDADEQTITYGPYGGWGASLGSKNVKNEYETIHDLTADQIRFGRVMGKITFVRQEYVEEVRRSDNGTSRVVVLKGYENEINAGQWKEGLDY